MQRRAAGRLRWTLSVPTELAVGRAVSETRSVGRGSAGGTAQHNTVTTAIAMLLVKVRIN